MKNKLILFWFEKLDILGVEGTFTYLRGSHDWYKDDPCIIQIKTTMLKKAFNDWLESKKIICKVNKHWCGVGFSQVTRYETYEDKIEIHDFETNKNIKVNMYNCLEIYNEIEHG
jgi:hypothetical protein